MSDLERQIRFQIEMEHVQGDVSLLKADVTQLKASVSNLLSTVESIKTDISWIKVIGSGLFTLNLAMLGYIISKLP